MRRIKRILLGCLWSAVWMGCTDSSETPVQNSVEVREALGTLSTQVYLPTVENFVDGAQALEEATRAHSEDFQNEQKRSDAQQAWRGAMAQWQRLELMQVGPLSDMGEDVGAQDLRVEIYSYPATFSSCKIDVELTEEDFRNVASFTDKDVKARGLDAIEYLLFSVSPDNECPSGASGHPINQGEPSSWDQVVDTLTERKATYAHTLSVMVLEAAHLVSQAWRAEGGNFIGQIQKAGLSGSDFESTQDALQAVFNGLFYIEELTKDMKIAWPTGIAVTSCQSCVEVNTSFLESRYAHVSKDNILSNLLAFQELFLGGTPNEDVTGLDDVLRSLGPDGEDLAERIEQGLSEIIETLSQKEGTMREILLAEPQFFRDFNDALKEKVIRPFKIEMTSYLGVETPSNLASDTD